MHVVKTGALELMEIWQDGDVERARARAAFPINRRSGAESSSIVYFEIEPGCYLPEHTDSAEEILYIVAGSAELHVGGERAVAHAGDLAVIPELVPHGARNVGDQTVRVVGFFSHEAIVSEFGEPLLPLGAATVEMAPLPAESRA